MTNSYVYAHAQVLLQHPGDWTAAKYFYMHDRLGSVRLVFESVWDTASSQYKPVVRNLYTYDAYGKRLGEGADTIETVYNPFQFTGQWYDAEIGQYYLRARQYDPQLLRFTSRDPVFGGYEDPLTLHRYLYCANDPINRMDLSGKEFSLGGVLSSMGIAAQLYGAGSMGWGLGQAITGQITWRDYGMQLLIDGATEVAGAGLFKLGNSILKAVARHGDDIVEGMSKILCFPAGTKIKTLSGLVPIENVKIGDLVWSFDSKTNQSILSTVTKTFINETDCLIAIRLKNDEIKTTPEHPFWIIGQGWTAAKDLKVKDHLKNLDGQAIEIEKVDVIFEKSIVYNFEVENTHNYYVAQSEILVHNKCVRGQVIEAVTEFMRGGKNNPLKALKNLDPEMQIGMRGSTVTNVRYSTGGPWDSTNFDLDIFIKSDTILSKYHHLIDENGFLKIGGKATNELKELYPELFKGLREGAEGFSIKVFPSSKDVGEAIYF